MKPYLLPIFVLLIVGCGNRNPANIVVENRIRQTEQTDSIIGDSYERDTIQGDFNGDGKIEYAYSESNPAEYYSLDEVDDGKVNNITFSNPTIPAIETEFQIERLTNEGDLNGDGTINDFDKRAIGKPNLPTTTLGWTIGGSWKGFSISVLFQGSFDYSFAINGTGIESGKSQFQPLHQKRWTQERYENGESIEFYFVLTGIIRLL